MFMWCLGKEWKVPVLNSPVPSSTCGCFTVFHNVPFCCWCLENFNVQCSSTLLGYLVHDAQRNTSPFCSSCCHNQDWEGILLCVCLFVCFFAFFFFFHIFIVNVSAKLNLCVLMLRILNTLSLGEANIWYKSLGRPLSVQHTSALVTSVPRSYSVVSHSCLLVLAQQKAGGLIEVEGDRALQQLGDLIPVKPFASYT